MIRSFFCFSVSIIVPSPCPSLQKYLFKRSTVNMFCVHPCVVTSHKLQTREDGTFSLILSRILIGIERGHDFYGRQSKECHRCVQSVKKMPQVCSTRPSDYWVQGRILYPVWELRQIRECFTIELLCNLCGLTGHTFFLSPSKTLIFSTPVNPPQTHLLPIPCFHS